MKIIADIGSCHGGSLQACYEAVDIAKESGVDIIKFQLFKGNKNGNIELPRQYWSDIVEKARKVGIDIFASVFDEEAIDLLIETGIKKAKLAYSQNFNLKLIKKLKENDFEIWASGDESRVPYYADKIFYCIAEYPPKQRIYNQSWKNLSSHWLGYNEDVEWARGREEGWGKGIYLEKHFHLNHKVDCPDYWFALSPKELKEMVKEIKA